MRFALFPKRSDSFIAVVMSIDHSPTVKTLDHQGCCRCGRRPKKPSHRATGEILRIVLKDSH
jgi:hypothetical protein